MYDIIHNLFDITSAIESLSHQLSQCQRTSYQNSDGQFTA